MDTLLYACVWVFILKDIRMRIDLKDGGCQRVNGFCMSLFPCCKALWENDSNYVVSLPTFVVSNQIYLNLDNFEVFPALLFTMFISRVSLKGSFHRNLGLLLWSDLISVFYLFILLGKSFNPRKMSNARLKT